MKLNVLQKASQGANSNLLVPHYHYHYRYCYSYRYYYYHYYYC